METALVYRSKLVLAAVAAGVAVAIPWYYVVREFQNAEPINSPLPAGSVLWGTNYFNTPRELSRWLHYRGVAYSVWATRHPRAAARIRL
jgi:4-amino-4-deoxy-L-arabinose transferase-like glycosyltransferase